MNQLVTNIYTKCNQLPPLKEGSYFHSRELMEILEAAPHQKPYMVVVTDEEGNELSHMLGIVRYRTLILPPYLLIHCRVLGEGVYADPATKDELLDEMVRALTEKLDNRVLYIEVSHMSQKMMGYKQLKQAGYYPVNWMSIHNSLHRRAPEERITEKLQRTIDNVHKRGLKTEVVKTEEDFKAFSRLLRKHNILKPKRFIPDNIFFRKVMESGYGELFVTKYHGWVDTMVVWDVMKHAYDKGCQHMRFMDVGLPYGKNPYREFILKFGGKEQSTYRWFRFSIKWVNKLLAWIYRE